MDLSNSLVKSFAEITNDKPLSSGEATVYGEISQLEDQLYAKIDGADVLTPVKSTVKVSNGDRVIVSLKNHTATVTGNLSDPAASSITVDEMGIHMKGLVSFESLENGTTTIHGGCIKTGKIEAQYLNLTGAITFEDLDEETQTTIENAAPRYQFSIDGKSGWHDIMSSVDKFRRDSTDGGVTWGEPYQFRGTDGAKGDPGEDAILPSYIHSTYISETEIQSPNIIAGTFYGNDFNIFAETSGSGSLNLYGYYNRSQYHFFEVRYYAGTAPNINIGSPDGALVYWDFTHTYFNGTVDFNECEVLGLSATFG